MKTCLAMAALATLCALPLQVSQAQAPPSIWPRCIAERAGQQFSQAGSVCDCGYDPGGTMVARPAGWRWTCDITRPDGSSLDIPAGTPDARLPPFGYGVPADAFDNRWRPQPGDPLGQRTQPPYRQSPFGGMPR